MDLAPLHELAAQQAAAHASARSYPTRVRADFGPRVDWIRERELRLARDILAVGGPL